MYIRIAYFFLYIYAQQYYLYYIGGVYFICYIWISEGCKHAATDDAYLAALSYFFPADDRNRRRLGSRYGIYGRKPKAGLSANGMDDISVVSGMLLELFVP